VAPIQKTGRIAIAFLPPYAPELNPVEAIWAYLKKHEIANPCPTHLAESATSHVGACDPCSDDRS